MINLGKVFILGDSYSTFENQIPEGYVPWYLTEYPENRINETDVNKLEQTWWYQFLAETKADLLLNCSYSGTTICNTGYGGSDCSNISFIGRIDKLFKKNYFTENKVDTFIIFGGTNDSWADSPAGKLMYSNWEKEDLFSVLPAFTYLLYKIKKNILNARIICIINTELKSEITEGFKVACEKFGVEAIELENISKTAGHPNIKGMKEIKNQVFGYLNKF